LSDLVVETYLLFFRVFGPAWLAYGHSFALENEHDQAMAAYFKASQLMKG
jgi:anaphase-promoting complex subunit 6